MNQRRKQRGEEGILKERHEKTFERKIKQKGTGQTQKSEAFFVWFFCGCKATREEITNNKFKSNGRTKRIFSHTIFFLPRDQKHKNRVFSNVFQESNNIFNFGYIKWSKEEKPSKKEE